jgi:hypothetical protein
LNGQALPVAQPRVWLVGQGVVLLGLVGLLAGLVAVPETALRLLWYAFIPVVPAVLLVSPGLWRNLCPLATINVATGRRWGRRALTPQAAQWTGAVGILLLVVLIAARRIVLDTNGPVLLGLLVVVAVAALVAGFLFDTKGGFCNAICPVLPVERLYGQLPWYEPQNPRCPTCTVCTRGGCLDLGATKSVAQTLGPARKTNRWMLKPFGAFALFFPGVVIGYFTVPEASMTSVAAVYGRVAMFAAISYGAGALLVVALRLGSERAMGLLAVLAFSLYYWYAAPAVVTELGLPAGVTAVIRMAALLLASAWLVRFQRRVRA